MSVSPFDHPYLSGLVGDDECSALFSAAADIRAMLDFEAALAAAEAEASLIPKDAAGVIAAACSGFEPEMAALRSGTARDGVVVPVLVEALRASVGEPYRSHVHFGATSQDVVDTSLALRLGRLAGIYDARLVSLIAALDRLDQRDGDLAVMAHTRMQAAIPVPAARKIRSWRDPLARLRGDLAAVRAGVAILSLGGAAGIAEKLGDRAAPVVAGVAERLGLHPAERARHSEREGIVAFASWLSMVTGCLGKMGQDIALAAQSELAEIRLASGGGSSAMPHKVNPVGAELLVTLARFNATLVSGMHQSLVHENERSGAAWALEWMLLPQMAVACGTALRRAGLLIETVSFAARGDGA